MTNTNDATNDAATRFSLLEMDTVPAKAPAPIQVPAAAPVAPAAPAPNADGSCSCGATRPLAVRGVCPRCQGRVARVVAPAPAAAPRGDVPADLRAELQERRAESDAARGALRTGDLIAGAVATGHGVLVSWSGKGELTRAQIVSLVAAAGCPADWAPAARTAHAQAGAALDTLNGRGYVVRAARSGGKTAAERGYKARWTVGAITHGGVVGGQLGTTVLVATLSLDGRLELDGDATLAAEVRVEFDRRTGGEVVGSADVTAWLRSVLVGHLGAVRLGGSYYVPRASVDQAVALCQEVATVWGCDWMLPALPIATSDQLRAGLANGLAAEAQDVLDELEAQRAAATKDGKSEIGSRAAATLLAKLIKVQDRAAGYAALLGEKETARVRGAIGKAVETIRPLVSDTTQRGNLIWEEVAGA